MELGKQFVTLAEDLTGVILCGGDAQRMDGVEKALQLVAGVPMVRHVYDRLEPQVHRVLVSANRHVAEYHRVLGNVDVVADAQRGLGPLGGIVSCLPRVETPLLFCCPGDAPFLHHALVHRLASALVAATGSVLAVAHDGIRMQHLFLCLRRDVSASLERYLADGGRSVHGFIAPRPHVVVDASDIADCFLNVNTSSDLRVANDVAADDPSLQHANRTPSPTSLPS